MLTPEGSIQGEANVISGRGFIARGDQLTIAIDGSDEAGIAALALLDLMRSQVAWSFENVAGALHELVIAQDPSGVAAVLDAPTDQILFLFDQGSASVEDRQVTANGRSGWTTEVVTAQTVGLRLAGASSAKPSGNVILRGGLVPGAGADVTMTSISAAPSFEPPPSTPSSVGPISTSTSLPPPVTVPLTTPPVVAPPPATPPPVTPPPVSTPSVPPPPPS